MLGDAALLARARADPGQQRRIAARDRLASRRRPSRGRRFAARLIDEILDRRLVGRRKRAESEGRRPQAGVEADLDDAAEAFERQRIKAASRSPKLDFL